MRPAIPEPVEAQVRRGRHHFQVFEGVVLGIAILVMDVMTGRDWAVDRLKNQTVLVFHDSAAIFLAEINEQGSTLRDVDRETLRALLRALHGP